MKPRTAAMVIGDLVGSREAPDRQALQVSLERGLAAVNAELRPLRPLRVTVGDEYQGVFATVGEAAQASLLVRTALLPDHDVRHGIGWGSATSLDDERGIEDGPGWWAARDAIEAAEDAAGSAATRRLRTAYARGRDAPDGPDPDWVNAALALRDEVVGGLSDRSLSVLRGLLSGQTQGEIAGRLGISPSAVSQRVRADGLATLVATHTRMGGAT